METVLGPQMCWRGRSRERGDVRVDGGLEPWVLCEDVPTSSTGIGTGWGRTGNES